jgi:hypothetical protein
MSLERKKAKQDPPVVIAKRERMRPMDFSGLEFESDEARSDWDYCWVHHGELMQAHYGAREWVTVSSKSDGVKAPHAFGGRTDAKIRHGDMILMKRRKDIGERERREDEEFRRYQMERRFEDNKETAAGMGVKDFTESLQMPEPEAI